MGGIIARTSQQMKPKEEEKQPQPEDETTANPLSDINVRSF